MDGVGEVYHFAAQVAVTSSLDDPLFDFAVNAGGTLNLLEALRALPSPPPVIFTSTNKVYGDLEDVELVPDGDRYVPADTETRIGGISEIAQRGLPQPVRLFERRRRSVRPRLRAHLRHSGGGLPYELHLRSAPVRHRGSRLGRAFSHSCDRRAADHDLRRRIAGPRLLYVDDLVDAFMRAQSAIGTVAGEAFNIGGGPERSTSLVELIEVIACPPRSRHRTRVRRVARGGSALLRQRHAQVC